MPISIALLFCIPTGFAFHYEARWLIRWATGRFGLKERRGVLAFGVFGGLLIPMIYCAGFTERAVSGEFEKYVAAARTMIVGVSIAVFAGWMFVTENRRKLNDRASRD